MNVDEATPSVMDQPAGDRAAPAADVPSRRGLTLLAPLRVRDFGLLFSGETVSLLGDQFHFVALAWLTLQLTGSGLALGTVLMIAAIPRAVFMLEGGAFSDRFPPRTLMLTSNVVRGVVVATLAALVFTNHAALWQLFVLAAIFGLVDAFFWPALNTLVPTLCPPEELPASNALMQGSQQLTLLIGPALAGLVVAAVQTGPAFAVDAVSFAVASGTLLLVRGGRTASSHPGSQPAGVLASIRSGLDYAWRDPVIRTMLVVTAVLNFAIEGPVSVGIAWMARVSWGGSAAFGLVFSAFGAGAVIGSLGAGSLRRVPHLGWVVLGVMSILGVLLAGLGLAPGAGIAIVIAALMGVGIGFVNVRAMAWLQGRAAPEVRGRLMSIVMLGSVGLTPISLAIAGAIVDLAAPAMFVVAGALIVVTAAGGMLWGGARSMEEPA